MISDFRKNIHNINSYLFILLGFSLPLSVSAGTGVVLLILLLWIVEGNFEYKLNVIKNNPITYAFLAFFLVHVLGLLWTENLDWGLKMLKKEWRILVLLVFITIIKKEHIKYYIIAFLASLVLSMLLSYGIWLELIPPFNNASVYNPTPFASHLSYGILLSFGVFIFIYLLFFTNFSQPIFLKWIYLLAIFLLSVNIFIISGRAGQVAFFVLFAVAIILYFKNNFKLGISLIFVVLPSIFLAAYTYSPTFNSRVNLIKEDILMLEKNRETSIGLRITFTQNSFKIIKENLLFGVGTGDFKSEYKKINDRHTPGVTIPDQPHNMYVLVLVQTGLLGLISMLSIFYMQFKTAFVKSLYKEIAIALPVLFLIIMLSDSYLLGHYTTLLFVYFSAFLYRDFKNENS